jgi:ankyrin repeat protein
MSDAVPLPPRPNVEQYKKLARDLKNACRSGTPDAIRQWATHWVEALERLGTFGVSPEHIERRWKRPAECTLAGVQLFIAREHGFTSWPKFARHIEELLRANSAASAFEAAADAIVHGDIATLRNLLSEHPGLAKERSAREHRSTLLHYVSANGVEDFRQKTPKNIVEITNLLLDSGADVNAESDAYRGKSTTLGLTATSIHPERAGVQLDLLRTLLNRGATFDDSIVNGCLANGQPEAARFFADLGAALDLQSAAALDRVDELPSYFTPELDTNKLVSAFLYACGYGSSNAVKLLLDRGVDPGSRNNLGETGLHWANYGPHLDVIRLLLQRGAPVDARENRFRAAPMDMALWTWNHTDDKEEREDCYKAVALLARAGAKLDPNQWRDPKQDSSAMLEKIDSDPRMQAALRGEQ